MQQPGAANINDSNGKKVVENVRVISRDNVVVSHV